MRMQRSSTMSRRAIYLLTGCLMTLGQAVNAQDGQGITTREIAGGVPAHGVMIVFNGQDIGASLLKASDANQDSVATATEVKAALLNWFQQADADKNSGLSEVELATALKSLFPMPQPPPGAPPLSEDRALYNLLAKQLMVVANANNDTWITSQEAIFFGDQNFSKWDTNGSGWLDASELAAAFAQLMPAPSFNKSFGTEAGPSLNTSLDH
jgi:hypothetical protein